MNKRLVIALLSIFFAAQAQAEPQSHAETQVLKTEAGRYVFGQVNSSAKNQFMLDTQTGRLWNVLAKRDGPGFVLQPVEYVNGSDYTWEPPEVNLSGLEAFESP